MAEYMDYIASSFEELEIKSKGTIYEGKRIYAYLDEYTAAPMVYLEIAKDLKLKNCKK
jgi:hypothetical protein